MIPRMCVSWSSRSSSPRPVAAQKPPCKSSPRWSERGPARRPSTQQSGSVKVKRTEPEGTGRNETGDAQIPRLRHDEWHEDGEVVVGTNPPRKTLDMTVRKLRLVIFGNSTRLERHVVVASRLVGRSRRPFDFPRRDVDIWQGNEETRGAIEENYLGLAGEKPRLEAVAPELLQKWLRPAARNATVELSCLGTLPEAAQPPAVLPAEEIEHVNVHLVIRHAAPCRILRERETAGHGSL
jgi:hypothetical protein